MAINISNISTIEAKQKFIKNNNEANETLGLISRAQYRLELRKYLSDEYFKVDNKHLLLYFTAMLIYFSSMYTILNISFLPIKLALSFVMGVALSSLTFFLHDLCHGSIVKSRKLEYLLGFSVGLLNFFPTLFWKRLHNYHHAKTGDLDDPDRSYIESETPKNIIEKFAYKTRMTKEAFNPILSMLIMSTGFFWYFTNTIYGLFFHKSESSNSKYRQIHNLFKTKAKAVIIFELISIFSFQACLLFLLAKGNLFSYLLISIIPVGIAHFTAMLYIHTNHFLSPLTGSIDDPLVNSLSIKNSKFTDTIFSNFSHHVEHHLFPYMSSSHYPKIRELLLKLYPERFKLITMSEAIKLLTQTPRIYRDFTHLITVDKKQVVECPFASNRK